MQKITAALVLSIIALSFSSIWSADAFAINWSACYMQPNHHCMGYVAKFGQTLQNSTLNYQFNAMLPDGTCNITGLQIAGGGCTAPMMILSPNNYTQTKEAPALMAMENIQQTGTAPNSNYCPFGLYMLTHQDGYLYLLYNTTTGVDLTGFVYPPTCYLETGPNPIDGNNTVTTPEFPNGISYMILIGLMSAIIIPTIMYQKRTASL